MPVNKDNLTYYTNDSILIVDDLQYDVQNVSATWSLTYLNSDTLRFVVAPGDHPSTDSEGKERSEVAGHTLYSSAETLTVNYKFMVEPGAPNTAAWLVLGQFHSNDLVTSPPFSVEMIGDKMAICIGYELPGQQTQSGKYIYIDDKNIERGHYYSMTLQLKFDTNGGGFAEVWRDGVQIADYHGPLGYGDQVYWKEGIYRAASGETVAADFAGLSITSSGKTSDDDAFVGTDGRDNHAGAETVQYGLAGSDRLTANGPAAALYGGGGKDRLIGGDGDDRLVGGSGPDVFSGGGGNDTFVFMNTPNGHSIDQIRDFSPLQDSIWLSRSAFPAIGQDGELPANLLAIGAHAKDADDRIVYNPFKGVLIYDSNGSDPGHEHIFAKIGAGLAITNDDFIIG